MAKAAQHTIVIDHEPFGVGYDVTIEPAPPGATLNREYPTIAGARGYAHGLSLRRGWPIRDLTGEGVE